MKADHPGLNIEGLSKSYPGHVQALRPIDLQVARGELLAVVGPSGCGKSTLLRLIAGLEEESSGQVTLDGKILNGLPPKTRDIAIVFQNYTLFPHLTLGDNMAFGLKVRGMPKRKALVLVEEVAQKLGIASLLHRMPHEVSGGERQRAALARALLRRPKLFLFDEPLSSLDAALRGQLRVEIAKLHRELSATMIFVTHDQSEALTLGDRVAVIHQGLLQQVAAPDDLYAYPANRFVASFIGNPGMSFLEGEVDKRVDAQGVKRFFHHPDLTGPLELPPEAWGELAERDAEARVRVVVGIRPEDIRAAIGGQAAETPGLVGRITLVERSGGWNLLYMQGERNSWVAKVESAAGLGLEDLCTVFPQWQKLRLFHAETGMALSRPQAKIKA